MSDPIKYLPGYSFSGWQAVNPSKPLPAPQVDNELANISTAIDQTVDAIKDIRRSDGQLNNGIVGVDALSTGISPGFVLRGQWAEGEHYLAADSVVFDSSFYRANVAHDATALNRPDLDDETWTFLFNVTDISGAMSAITYDPQNIVADAFNRANHTGAQAISTVTGLQTALNGKAALVHTHAISDVTDLQTTLDGKQPLIHTSTMKGTLADGDEFAGADSAASYSAIRFTLTNLVSSIFKTTRKIANAYFLSSLRIWDATDNTKGLAFDLSGITTATTLTIDPTKLGIRRGIPSTLSGTAFTFSSIPAGVKRVTISYRNLGYSASASFWLLLGTSGGLASTGYDCNTFNITSGGTNSKISSTGAHRMNTAPDTNGNTGKIVLEREGTSNNWTVEGFGWNSAGGETRNYSQVALSGELTQVQWGTSGPTLSGTSAIDWEF